MQIVIPMSGLGARFSSAGYKDIKPLIKVHGKPIIEWVVDLFPGEHNFIFICREEHLKQTPLRKELERIKPESKIIPIEGHKKGPVYAVSKVFNLIDDESPVITNYCDFFMKWDYNHFKAIVGQTNCEGAIPCYTGFHPHLLHEKNLYAGCRTDEVNNLIEIKEKYSFTGDKTQGQHSTGTYYFKSGKILKNYFEELMSKDINLQGEYYISLVYNLLVRDHLKVITYTDIPHFCQWGTPEDLQEYSYWAKIFKKAI
ncbi:MAG: glycosyltransferase family 2 protein [Cytophagaceae bacterium]